MGVLDQVSSRIGDRTSGSNRAVANQCLADPAPLVEVAQGLAGQDVNLIGDCAEVFTMVAESHPQHVAPYANRLAPLLSHKNTRVRWEATHAIALIAANVPEVVAARLPQLREMISKDGSVIVRDYAIDAVGNYANWSADAARQAHPLLRESLILWNGKHARHALEGLANAVKRAPELAEELSSVAESYLNDGRAIVRKAAKTLQRIASARGQSSPGRLRP